MFCRSIIRARPLGIFPKPLKLFHNTLGLNSPVYICQPTVILQNRINHDYANKNNNHIVRYQSTDSSKDNEQKKLSNAQRLKKAVAEYGTTVIVFHVGISLISLGTCYLAVSWGLDLDELLIAIGIKEWAVKNTLASNAGTFAVAYGIHKIFAPVRIGITLASVPFIVKYLRSKGVLRK